MARALMKILRSDDAETLKEKIADIEQRQSVLLERLAANQKARELNALPAVDGDDVAKAALDKANADHRDIQARLGDLNLALDQARKNLVEEEERAAAVERKSRAAEQNARLKARLDDAKKAEKLMLELTETLDRMSGSAAQIIEASSEFRRSRSAGGAMIVDQRYLWPDHVSDRLNAFAQKCGLQKHFDPDQFQVQRTPHILGPGRELGFVEGEQAAHREYETSEG